MVARSRENLSALKAAASFDLYVGLAQDTVQVLRAQGKSGKYDVILVNGVLMYLNDDDLEKTFAAINELAADHAVLYLKESMGVERRLTLQEIHSDALHQDYSAIYRSIAEYEALFREAFGGSFSLKEQGPLFDDSMRNRRETLDYYFIWKR